MGKSLVKGLAILCLLFGLNMPAAFADHDERQQSNPDSYLQDMRQKYAQQRLDHIARETGLTVDEKAFVAQELTKYDNNRIELYQKAKELREDLAKPGLSDKEYLSLLKDALETDLGRAKETMNLFKRLEAKLSPEKRAKVYTALRSFNSKMGQKIRKPKKLTH